MPGNKLADDLTKREYIATQIMASLSIQMRLSPPEVQKTGDYLDILTAASVKAADALLKELDKN